MFEEHADLFRNKLAGRTSFTPYPRLEDRETWSRLCPDVRRSVIERADTFVNYKWPALPATLYLDYRRTGNRTRYQEPYYQRRTALGYLTVAECLTAEGRYVDDILNGMWAICEETSWVIPAHNRREDASPRAGLPDSRDVEIDLFAAETGAGLAVAAYLLERTLASAAPAVLARANLELRTRILDPYLERTDQWWMGYHKERRLNNWTPWCTSNCLLTCYLQEDDDNHRRAATGKACFSLDRFLSVYHEDGGCDEGASYWNRAAGSLFDCIEILNAATGGAASDLYRRPLIRAMMGYLADAHIGDDWFLNFADGPARMIPRAGLIYRVGAAVDNSVMTALATDVVARHGPDALAAYDGDSMHRYIPALLLSKRIAAERRPLRHQPLRWMDGIEVFIARGARGLFLAAKGGNNGESHNHNDVGTVVVFNGNRPVLIDIGVEEYTAKTFSERRYEIWTMQSSFHNLPEVDGRMQLPGLERCARAIRHTEGGDGPSLTLDIAAAYPEAAGVKRWTRTTQALTAEGSAEAVRIDEDFELNGPRSVCLFFLTAYRPDLDSRNNRVVVMLEEAKARIEITGVNSGADGRALQLGAAVEELQVADDRLRRIWGPAVFRTRVTIAETAAGQVTTIVALEPSELEPAKPERRGS